MMENSTNNAQSQAAKNSNQSNIPSGLYLQEENFQPLKQVAEIEAFDINQELKIKPIGAVRSDIPARENVSSYEEALLKADLSQLGVESEKVKKSIATPGGGSSSFIEEVVFKTPEELNDLHPQQKKEMKVKILNDIRRRISSDDDQERYEAIQQFSYYIDDNNIVLLNKLVTDNNSYIKEEIISLVSKFKNNNAISILEALKRDPESNISTKALEALAAIDPRYAKPVTTVEKKIEDRPAEQDQPKQEKGGISSIFKKI